MCISFPFYETFPFALQFHLTEISLMYIVDTSRWTSTWLILMMCFHFVLSTTAVKLCAVLTVCCSVSFVFKIKFISVKYTCQPLPWFRHILADHVLASRFPSSGRKRDRYCHSKFMWPSKHRIGRIRLILCTLFQGSGAPAVLHCQA